MNMQRESLQNIRVSPDGVILAAKHEGFRSKAYIDPVGIPTIGYGLTRYFHRPGHPKVRMGEVIDHEEALKALEWTLNDFLRQVQPHIRYQLTQGQIDAIASFVYNVGVSNFLKSTMLKKINAGDFQGAAEQFPRWNKAGGKVLPGLVKRREHEKQMFLGISR